MNNYRENIKDTILINSENNSDIRSVLTLLEDECRVTIAMKNSRSLHDEIHVDLLVFTLEPEQDVEIVTEKLVKFLQGYRDCEKTLGFEGTMDLLINKRRLEVHGKLYSFDNMHSTVMVLNKKTLNDLFKGDYTTYINNVLIAFSKANCDSLNKLYKSRKEFKVYDTELELLNKQELMYNLS